MILKKLKLQNIRSYQNQDINFPEGIVLLSGDIGAGKTTILLAIEFALFGFSKRTLSGDLLLRHGKHEGSVELSFFLNTDNNTSNNQNYSANNNQEYTAKDNTKNNQNNVQSNNETNNQNNTQNNILSNNEANNQDNTQNNILSNNKTNNQNNTQNNIQSNGQLNRQKEVIIKRTLRRSNQVKQESGYIIVDGVKTECTPSELKTKVLELLGYPQEMVTKSTDVIYRYTVYTPQEQMKQILWEEASTRLETLRRVFDIDKYRRITENSNVVLKDLKNRKSELVGKTSDLEGKKRIKSEKNLQRTELYEKFKAKNSQLETIKKEILKKKNDLLAAELKIKELVALKNNFAINEVRLKNITEQKQDNEKRIGMLIAQIKKLEADITNFKIIKPEEVNRQNLEDELAAEEKFLDDIKEKKIKLAQEIEFNNTKITEISEEIKEKKELAKDVMKKKHDIELIQKEIEGKKALTDTAEKLGKRIEELNMLIKERDIEINKANKLKKEILSITKCPTCLQNIDDGHKDHITLIEDKKIKNANDVIRDVEIERKEKLKEKEKINKNLEDLREQEKLIEKLKAEFSVLEKYSTELEKKQRMLEEFVKIRNHLKEEKTSAENINPELIKEKINHKKEILFKIREYDERVKQKQMKEQDYHEKNEELMHLRASSENLGKSINETKANLSAVEQKITSFENIETQYNILKKDVDEKLSLERAIELEIAGLNKQIDYTNEYLNLLDKEITEKEEAKKTIDKIDFLVNWIDEFFTNLMRTMEKHIMMKLYYEFNEVFMEWFSKLIEDENLSAKLNDEFTPIIIQNGYETTLENLSGGERSAVALAYRLALNKVVNSFITSINTKNLIILDEPTDGFSQEQLDKIKDVLDELNIKQIILVSHESKIESFAEHIIRITKSEHVSCVV
ncbi:SMC family ATPase [Candidatus Woesearchaeota archaeon]|nr:SMC family ATPase [Candidatus Woesearchaeota archaeon]